MTDDKFKISLEAARINAGVKSREKAGELIGVHKDTVYSWESGRTLPDLKYIPAIEKAYHIPYDRIRFTT